MAAPKVVCITMHFNGGALTPALRRLGYTPYSLYNTFAEGNVSTHPLEWKGLLEGSKTKLEFQMLEKGGFDALVGPPSSLLYYNILQQCPRSTRVILVEEEKKLEWEKDIDVVIPRLLALTSSISKVGVSEHLHFMLENMLVGSAPSNSGNSDGYGNIRSSFRKGARGAGSTLGVVKRVSRSVALNVFEDEVKQNVPRDRLLVYKYGDGWEPLCAFLERPVPLRAAAADETGASATCAAIPHDAVQNAVEPFPPYTTDLDVVETLSGRLQRTKQAMTLIALFFVAFALTILWAFWGVIQDTYGQYKADLSAAFLPKLKGKAPNSAHGGGDGGDEEFRTMRDALKVFKRVTEEFEEKQHFEGSVMERASESFRRQFVGKPQESVAPQTATQRSE